MVRNNILETQALRAWNKGYDGGAIDPEETAFAYFMLGRGKRGRVADLRERYPKAWDRAMRLWNSEHFLDGAISPEDNAIRFYIAGRRSR